MEADSFYTKSSSTDRDILASVSESTRHRVPVGGDNRQRVLANQQQIETAVYSHIKAMRALGRTSLNTTEIARALSISRKDVERAVPNLRDKGVRRIG